MLVKWAPCHKVVDKYKTATGTWTYLNFADTCPIVPLEEMPQFACAFATVNSITWTARLWRPLPTWVPVHLHVSCVNVACVGFFQASLRATCYRQCYHPYEGNERGWDFRRQWNSQNHRVLASCGSELIVSIFAARLRRGAAHPLRYPGDTLNIYLLTDCLYNTLVLC